MDGIAQILDENGRSEEALERWRDALDIYTDLGVPEADQIAYRLAALTDRDDV